MWNEPPYFREIIDPESPGVDKYISLVSSPDSGKDAEVHHIVPVAYFKDVLGRTDCRMAGSPDMNPVNLVPLSKGRHVLAHFYLAKYAKKCIAVQMRNAFCQTYQTTDFSKVTEEEVLSRIDEINAEYARLKTAKKEHKDGVEIRRTKTCVSLNNWKDGKKVGVSMKWAPDGIRKHIHNNDLCFTIESKTYKGYSYIRDYQIFGEFSYGANQKARIDSPIVMRLVENGRTYISIDINIHDSMLCIKYAPGRHKLEWYGSKHIGFGVRCDKTRWEELDKFLSAEENQEIAKCIRSMHVYLGMLEANVSDSTKELLGRLLSVIGEGDTFPVFDVPEFPTQKPTNINFDRVDTEGLWLTQVRDGKRVAHYNWWKNGRINGIVQEGLPSVYFDGMDIQVNGWKRLGLLHDVMTYTYDGEPVYGGSYPDGDVRVHIPKKWNRMSDAERVAHVQKLFPVLANLNPIPKKPEPGGKTKIQVSA